MRDLNKRSRRVATAAVTAVALVASTTGCASAGSVLFPATAPSRPEARTQIVSLTTTEGHAIDSFQPAALESLGLKSPMLMGTADTTSYPNPFIRQTPTESQDTATFEIVVGGGRSFFSDPIQMGGAALVLALLASFVSGSECTVMAESSGRC